MGLLNKKLGLEYSSGVCVLPNIYQDKRLTRAGQKQDKDC